MLIQCRDYDILSWLDHMSFLNRDHIKRVFFKKARNSARAPYRRLLKLREAGLVETVKVYSDPRDLYVPRDIVKCCGWEFEVSRILPAFSFFKL